jgi:hypothetical protein
MAESCLVSAVQPTSTETIDSWSNDELNRGIIDLYARRRAAVVERETEAQQDALDRIVVTQPFGRAFTAQPSFPPDPSEDARGLAGLRKKLAEAAPGPRRKLATS